MDKWEPLASGRRKEEGGRGGEAGGGGAKLWVENPLEPGMNLSAGSHNVGRYQGLTLVHFSAQRQCFLWDAGAFRYCLGAVCGSTGGLYGVLCVRNGSGRAEKWTRVSPWAVPRQNPC